MTEDRLFKVLLSRQKMEVDSMLSRIINFFKRLFRRKKFTKEQLIQLYVNKLFLESLSEGLTDKSYNDLLKERF